MCSCVSNRLLVHCTLELRVAPCAESDGWILEPVVVERNKKSWTSSYTMNVRNAVRSLRIFRLHKNRKTPTPVFVNPCVLLCIKSNSTQTHIAYIRRKKERKKKMYEEFTRKRKIRNKHTQFCSVDFHCLVTGIIHILCVWCESTILLLYSIAIFPIFSSPIFHHFFPLSKKIYTVKTTAKHIKLPIYTTNNTKIKRPNKHHFYAFHFYCLDDVA